MEVEEGRTAVETPGFRVGVVDNLFVEVLGVGLGKEKNHKNQQYAGFKSCLHLGL
jgi:hypothetical protein